MRHRLGLAEWVDGSEDVGLGEERTGFADLVFLRWKRWWVIMAGLRSGEDGDFEEAVGEVNDLW